MDIVFHRQFKKQLKKLPAKVQDRFYSRLDLFAKDMTHPTLNNHSVDPVFPDCRSINVTGDYRAVFRVEVDSVAFITIATHSELY